MKVKITFTKFAARGPRGPRLSRQWTHPLEETVMRTQLIFACLMSSFALACGGSDDEEQTTQSFDELAAPAIAQYGDVVYQSYSGAHDGAVALDDACKAFVAGPTTATQTDAQQAWLSSRPVYLQTEVYRFYGGPIDDDDGPEGQINAWPMDESHIDYVMGDPDAGIINDPEREITPAALEAANETPSEDSISTGYHAIEFLHWGQDMK